LADEMGLGKTVQVVCFLRHIIKGSFTRSPSLVIVPKTILLQWKKVCVSAMIFCHIALKVVLRELKTMS
jgi:SNF2 family DNA or RNA helicase